MNRIFTAALAVAALAFGMHGASAATYAVEHNFCTKADCPDGSQPASAPVADASGNYYGTTVQGGSKDGGTIYRMSFNGTAWKSSVIHSFCLKTDCADGNAPQGGLVVDTAGNLYGMTNAGGYSDSGVVYELSPDGAKWTYTILYKFCRKTNCPDGQHPAFASLSYRGAASGVAYDGTSPLYGTTQMGGAQNTGVVFQLTPSGGAWTESTVYDFCALANCIDGGFPFAGVTVDASGNLFGAASLGGVGEDEECCGVLFELKHGAHWSYTMLHEFCSDVVGEICLDGQAVFAPPIMDAMGNLYGTTVIGGSHNSGTIYKLVPNGDKSKLTVLYNFCAKADCPDGAFPWAGPLAMDASGTLYGSASQGGTGAGTIFSLGGTKLNKFKTLVVLKGPNGAGPQGGLALDPSGALYGVTPGGGKGIQGVFFQLTP